LEENDELLPEYQLTIRRGKSKVIIFH